MALFVGLGVGRFAYAPMIPALVAAGWFSPAAADFLSGVNLAGYLLGAAVAGAWLAHRTPAAWLRAAMLATAASLAALAWPWGLAWYFLWRLLAGIAAGVLMVLAVPAVLGHATPARRGILSGLVFGGVGAGVVFSGEAAPLLVARGLATAWITLAAVVLVLTAWTWPFWGRLPGVPTHHGEAAEGAATNRSGRGRSPRVWEAQASFVLLLAAYCGNAVGFAPHSLFWVDYIARQLGRGLAVGGHYYLLFGLGVTLGPSLAGWMGDRWGIRLCLALALALEAAAVALPLWGSAALVLGASSLLVGAAGMGSTALASARTIEIAAPARRTRMWGSMTLAFSIAYAVAGMGDAALYAHAGRYQPLFTLAALALAAGAVLAALAG